MKNLNPPFNATPLSVGSLFRAGATIFRIIALYNSNVTLEHIVTGEKLTILQKEFLRDYLESKFTPCGEDERNRALTGDVFLEDDTPYVLQGATITLSPTAQARGVLIIKLRKALLDAGHHSLRPTPLLHLEYERVVRQLGINSPPKLSTIYTRDLAIRKAGGDLHAAFPDYASRGGRNAIRNHQHAINQLDQILDGFAKNNEKIIISEIENDLKAKLLNTISDQRLIPLMPSRSTISRHVKKRFSAFEIAARKEGRTKADRIYQSYYPRDRVKEPLQVVELDDKDTRTYGIDELTGLPFGRIFLTTGLDQYSRVPLGFSISEKRRDTASAINTLANCILPKDLTHPDWAGVHGDIPFYGRICIPIFDNALYNHAHALQLAAIEMTNAAIQFAKPRAPTEKSIVEGFFKILDEKFLCTLPGHSGQKNPNGDTAGAQRSACMSTQKFRQGLFKWVYNVFCNDAGTLGSTPRQLFETAMRGKPPYLPYDIRRIRLGAMLNNEIKFRSEIIHHNHLSYRNHRAAALRKQMGHNAHVQIKYDPQNLTYIYAFDPYENEWFQVPTSNPEYTTGLTLYQHELIRKIAKENGKANPATHELLACRQELIVLVEQLRRSSKLKERSRAVNIGSPSLSHGEESHTTEIVTELEDKMIEIENIPMDLDDDSWVMPEQGDGTY